MITDTKKLQLIKQIAEIEDQALIDQREDIINASSQTKELLANIASPIKKEFDLERIKKEQNFQPIDRDEVNRLIQEADIQEPIEELLAMLRP